jgi:hypothetical protein
MKPSTEIPLKRWVAEEAVRTGLHPTTVYRRFEAGRYLTLTVRRVNQRVIFVENRAADSHDANQ